VYGLTLVIVIYGAMQTPSNLSITRRNGKVQERSGTVNLVLAFAAGYNQSQIKALVLTFQKWNPLARLIIFTDSVTLLASGMPCPNPASLHFVDISSVDIGQNIPSNPVIRRFAVYKAWLTNEGYSKFGFLPGKCFHVDARDTFFQGDVFEPMAYDGLYIFEESVSLRNEPHYNQPWIKECYGNDILQQMLVSDFFVLNAGIVGASNVTYFVSFLDSMVDVLSTKHCNDQGLFNYLAHFVLPQRMPVHVMGMTTDSWVAHALTSYNPSNPAAHPNTHLAPMEGVTIDALGRIVGPHGILYAIVHQADRFSRMWELRFQDQAMLSDQSATLSTQNPARHPIPPLRKFVFVQDQ
jgi:hypothetical protein